MATPNGVRSSAPSVSAEVYTATTPGTSAASETSTSVSRAWAMVERTKCTCRAPSSSGSCRSAVYVLAPVRNAGSSRRWTRVPITLMRYHSPTSVGPAGLTRRRAQATGRRWRVSAFEGGAETVERPGLRNPHRVLGRRGLVVQLVARHGQAVVAGELLDLLVGAQRVGLLLGRGVGGVELLQLGLGRRRRAALVEQGAR